MENKNKINDILASKGSAASGKGAAPDQERSGEIPSSETFKSVKVSVIARAFACAHHYSQNAGSNDDRARFRHVARLIWDACGEQTTMPHILPPNLKVLIDAGEFRDPSPGRAEAIPTKPENSTEAES